MKKLLLLFLLFSNYAFAQKVVRDEVDPFSKVRVKETKTTGLYQTMFEGIKQHVKNADSSLYLYLHTSFSNVYSVSKGDGLQLIFDDSVTVEVQCVSGGVASPLSTNWLADIAYKLTPEAINAIRNKTLIAMNMQMTRGYRKINGIKEKNARKLREAVENVLK